MILLRDLLAPWFHYSGSESITHLRINSDAIDANEAFVAVPGHNVDGRQFIAAAFLRGATAAIVHTDDPDEHGRVSRDDGGLQIYFFQLQRQLSVLAYQLYQLTLKSMQLIGITGTNGKTSVSQLIAQLGQKMALKTAVMGTLGNGIWGHLVADSNTTSDAITVMRQLQQFEQQDVDVCALEVSSHGLVQGRVDAVPFKIAVFTNLSRDHLDYHHTMDAYKAAKQRFLQFNSLEKRLINADDPVGAQWLKEQNHPGLVGFSHNANAAASIYAKDVTSHANGVSATLVWPEGKARFDSPLIGTFNLSNLIAALGALYLCGYPMKKLIDGVASLQPVAGRMERFIMANGLTLVVDYAHTPDALTQALAAIGEHCQGKLWCVFGSGGDRDKGKRPLMAQAAENNADRVMVTSDNARSEDPQAIIDDILAGFTRSEKVLTEIDRPTAIAQVVAQAAPEDWILLAGKGHECYQEIDGRRIDYEERALVASMSRSGSCYH